MIVVRGNLHLTIYWVKPNLKSVNMNFVNNINKFWRLNPNTS